jgi:hypothetical protein
MEPVCFHIHQIIHGVHRTCQQAKYGKCRPRRDHQIKLKQVFGEKNWRNYKCVFQPLMRAKGSNNSAEPPKYGTFPRFWQQRK